MKQHVADQLLSDLWKIRNTNPEASPFMTPSSEFWFVCGLLAGMYRSGSINGNEYDRLQTLAGNAYKTRSKELQA